MTIRKQRSVVARKTASNASLETDPKTIKKTVKARTRKTEVPATDENAPNVSRVKKKPKQEYKRIIKAYPPTRFADLEVEELFGAPEIQLAGVDEAGRGPLAGPVVAAAVILDSGKPCEGLQDSKKMTKKQREALYATITTQYDYGVGIVSPEDIDDVNILEATKIACVKAVESLKNAPRIVLVDGNMKFADERFFSLIKGDSKSMSIAAASIVAKVTRDRIMDELATEYPDYGWSKNMGYGTKDHVKAIVKHGHTPYHRRSFKLKGIDIPETVAK